MADHLPFVDALAALTQEALRSLDPRDKVSVDVLRRSAYMPFQLPFVWQKLAGYQVLFDAADRDSDLRQPVLTPWDQRLSDDLSRRAMLDGFLSGFFADYVAVRAPERTWNRRVFLRLANRFIASLMDNLSRYTLWAAIHRFDVTNFRRRLILAPGLSLERPSAIVRHTLAEPIYPNRPLMQDLHSPPHFFLRNPAVRRLRGAREFDSEKAAMIDCVTAIRLVGGGFAHIKEIVAVAEYGSARVGPRRLGMHQAQIAGFHPAGTRLDSTQFSEVRRRLAAIPHLKSEFRVALERFESLGYRTNIDDRLLDSVTGLESLLLPDEQQELSFRFAVRGACLLAGDLAVRAEWRRTLSRVYAARSRVVHGDVKRLPQVDAEAAAQAPRILGSILAIAAQSRLKRSAWKKLIEALPFGQAPSGPGPRRI